MTYPLPRGIAWFAPWTWKRRTLWTIAIVALIGIYIELPVILGARIPPATMVLGKRVTRSPMLSFPGPLFYPLAYCCERYPACLEFYRAQADALMPVADYVRYQRVMPRVQTIKSAGNIQRRYGPAAPKWLIDGPRFDIRSVEKIGVRED